MPPNLVLAFLDYLAVSPVVTAVSVSVTDFTNYLFGVALELNKQVVDKMLT